MRRMSLSLCLIVFALAPLHAQGKGKPASITVVCDNNYPPYAFVTEDGRLQGIVPDMWEAWEAATGVTVNLVGMDWHDALEAMEQGRADAIDTIVKSEEREGWLDFTQAYTSFDVPVFFHRSIASISNLFDLRGYRVAVKSGDYCLDILRANSVTDLREYPSYQAIVEAAIRGDERVFCMDEPPVLYLLFKRDAVSEFKRSVVVYTASFSRAVRNGDRDMLALVNEGFRSLGGQALDRIKSRWLGVTVDDAVNSRVLWTLVVILGLIALVAANMTVAALYFRRRVSLRTAELDAKVAELSDSENRMRAIVRGLPDFLIILDKDCRILELRTGNERYRNRPMLAFQGKTVADAPYGGIELQTRLQQAIGEAKIKNAAAVFVQAFKGRNGERFIEARVVALDDGRALCIARDVTERVTSRQRLMDSLREKEALLREIHHRVKNNLQIVSSLLSIQADRFRDSHDRALFAESQSRIKAMAHVHDQLYRSGDFASIPAREYIEDLLGEVCTAFAQWSKDRCVTSYAVDSDGSALPLDLAVPCGLLVNELATNAFKYAFGPEGGTLFVSVKMDEGGTLVISVEDDGAGLPDGFDPGTSGGMGYTIIGALIQQLGGSLETGRSPRGGASITLRVPLAKAQEPAGS